jgi:hypothetical protein
MSFIFVSFFLLSLQRDMCPTFLQFCSKPSYSSLGGWFSFLSWPDTEPDKKSQTIPSLFSPSSHPLHVLYHPLKGLSPLFFLIQIPLSVYLVSNHGGKALDDGGWVCVMIVHRRGQRTEKVVCGRAK